MNEITIGDKVRFEARGNRVEGVVTERKYKRPGSRNPIVKLHNLTSPVIPMLTIADDNGRGVRTVPERSCQRISASKSKAREAAQSQVSKLRGQIFEAESKRRSENFDKAEERGLSSLKRGDKIEVEFRGGYWRECQFDKLTGSGMVGFTRDGDYKFDALGLTKTLRVRFTAPEFVRVP